MLGAIISLLAALFKAFPSIKSMFSDAMALADKGNIASAIHRKMEKDAENEKAIREILGTDRKNEDV